MTKTDLLKTTFLISEETLLSYCAVIVPEIERGLLNEQYFTDDDSGRSYSVGWL